MSDSDDLISQFMAFTGCSDGERAQQYLEMSNMNVETAVGLFMEHQGNASGAGGALDGAGGPLGALADSAGIPGGPLSPEIRAPDRTQTMRLMDDGMGGHAMMGGMGHPMMGMGGIGGYPDMEDDIAMGAFTNIDARAAVNAAAAADASASANAFAGDGAAHGEDHKENDSQDEKTPADDVGDSLSNMFAPPTHLMHRGGGFQGARNSAKDARRWLLVNIQRDSDFACHALNRDVWRDELVENLVREGFIFWQARDTSQEGTTYTERYKVFDFPHIAIIDPRTGRSLWKKEGWTQENPFTPDKFAEMAMDFCSRHSFDKDPLPPKKPPAAAAAAGAATNNGSGTSSDGERKRPFMSEDEQLQAAMAASLKSNGTDDMEEVDKDQDDYVMEDDDADEIECLGTKQQVEEAAKKEPSFIESLLAETLADEPADGARVQIRMPDGKRNVRKFAKTDPVKSIYAFVAQNTDEAKDGKEFILLAGFPPKDLIGDIDRTMDACGLCGQAVSVRWKA